MSAAVTTARARRLHPVPPPRPGSSLGARPTREPGAPAPQVRCRHCGSGRTLTIALVLTDGTPVDFTACRACEGKSWVGAEGPLPLARVLARATRTR